MRVLGIDPGLRNMGWGVIKIDGNRITHIGNGVIHSTKKHMPDRLCELFYGLQGVVETYAPNVAAVEKTFVNKNADSTLKLGQARAIAILTPALKEIHVAEYAPNEVKKVIVGVGHADKTQVEHMVRLQLPGVTLQNADATDALAIALCHAHMTKFQGRLASAIVRAL